MKIHYHKLNILKLFALTHIFFCHALNYKGYNFPQENLLYNFISANFYSTSLFIILNGFLLTIFYLNKIDYTTITNFFYKRIKKFYLLYLVVIIISIPIIFNVSSSFFTGMIKIIINIFLLQAWVNNLSNFAFTNFYWTLSCFMFYYIFYVPLLKKLSSFTKNQLILLLLSSNLFEIVLSYYLYDSNLFPNINKFLHHNPIIRFPEFLGGCIAGILFIKNFYGNLISFVKKYQLYIILLNLIAISVTKYIPYIIAHNGLFLLLQILLILSLTTYQKQYNRLTLYLSNLGQSSFYFYMINGLFLYIFFNFTKIINTIFKSDLILKFQLTYDYNLIKYLSTFSPNLLSITIICIFCLYISKFLQQKFSYR